MEFVIQTCAGKTGAVRRYLPHGKPTDLYWQYLAWHEGREPNRCPTKALGPQSHFDMGNMQEDDAEDVNQQLEHFLEGVSKVADLVPNPTMHSVSCMPSIPPLRSSSVVPTHVAFICSAVLGKRTLAF